MTPASSRIVVNDLQQMEGVWSAAVSEAKGRGATLPTAAAVEEVVKAWKENQRPKDVEPVAADVEPVDDEQPTEQLPIAKDVDSVEGECSNCGSYERGDDGECGQCRDPYPDGGEDDDAGPEEEASPGGGVFEELKEAIAAWRKLYPRIDDAAAAAMVENVAILIREEMSP